MLKRLANFFRAIFNAFMTKVEDPEMLLDQARRDMAEALSSNREKAVQALAMKNRLAALVQETEMRGRQCEVKAEAALKQGNRDMALQFMAEKKRHESSLTGLKESLAKAEVTVGHVKEGIKYQENQIRQKTAEALALKAQWKQSQIQSAITKSLEGLSFENELEGWGAATEKIKNSTAEADARQEMFNDSIAGKVMQLENTQDDIDAEDDLKQLEARLGLASPGTVDAGATAQTASVEDDLATLEARLKV
ncbi:MAG: PspA/IM30 family protein [Armatimonadetes bacterium]|nr:PspA/IM30 family protein [Armatimonadota bacterium]